MGRLFSKGATAWAVALAAGLAIEAPAAAQQDFSKVEVKASPVSGKVYMLQGAGGNIGVSVGSDGLLIVDDQYAPLAEKIRAALAALGGGLPGGQGQGGKLKFVLNTHWHGDHTGGNEHFGAEAPIVAHTNVRKRMAVEQTVFGEKVPASPEKALPVVTFDQSLSIHFNGEEIQAVHFPNGHTDGDTVVFFTGSNVVHLGDDYFAGRFPFVDLGSGGSATGLLDNIDRILARLPEDVKVIPGHGPLSTKKDLADYRGMLAETTGIVRERIAAGQSLEQIKKAGLPEKWKEWGSGFVKTDFWLETVYNSLQGKGGTPRSAAADHGHGHSHGHQH
jgi:glyoxylase-like metal-dependent hydrolase (beta-lactamase superfamily II)